MTVQVITNPQLTSPNAADSVSVVATGVAWTDTAWVQIAPTTDTTWALTQVIVWTNIVAAVTIDFEVDIGVGAAGLETVIATVRGQFRTAGVVMYQQPIRLSIPIHTLTGRHVCRLRIGSTRTDTWHIAIGYVKMPIVGTLLTTASPALTAPAAAASITLTAGTSWVSGSWAEIISSTATAAVLIAVILQINSVTQAELDIGIGNSGSETVLTTIRYGTQVGQVSPSLFTLPNPLDVIPVSSRISARLRAATGGSTGSVALMYHAKPL